MEQTQCNKVVHVNSECSDLKHLLGFSGLEKNNATVKRVMLISLPVLCSSGSQDESREGFFSIILFFHENLGKALSLLQGEEEEQDAAEEGLLGESLIVLLTLFWLAGVQKLQDLHWKVFHFYGTFW